MKERIGSLNEFQTHNEFQSYIHIRYDTCITEVKNISLATYVIIDLQETLVII